MRNHSTTVRITSKYSMFLRHRKNPDTRTSDQKLVESMRMYGWLDGMPMMVTGNGDGTYTIVEGHRRFNAAQMAGVPVKYVVNGDEFDPMFISSLVRPWSVKDRVKSYAQTGNQDYKTLDEFCSLADVSIGTGAVILGMGSCSAALRDGTFSVEDTHAASKILSVMRAIRGSDDKPKHKWWNSVKLATALTLIYKYVDSFDVDKMRARISTHRAFLEQQVNSDKYIEMLQGIYNRFSRGGERVEFCVAIKNGVSAAQREAIAKVNKAKAKASGGGQLKGKPNTKHHKQASKSDLLGGYWKA